MRIPFYHYQSDEEELSALKDVLDSGQLTYGKKVLEFEEEFLTYTQSRYVYALNSATSALHLAFIAGGIGKSDIVVIPTNTYTATATSAKYVGADILFCDVDPKTGLLSLEHLKELLTQYKVKAVVAVNIAGSSCDIEAINELKKDYQFLLIEDAAHGFYLNQGALSDFTIFSFHPNKVLGSLEGGVIAFNKEEYRSSLKLLKSMGIQREEKGLPWQYEVKELGHKYAMNSMCAALLLIRLKKAESDFLKRKELVENYERLFLQFKIPDLEIVQTGKTNFHLFRILVEKRNELSIYLLDQGIEASVHYRPLHTHSYWRENSIFHQNLKNAEDYYEKVLSLPLYPELSCEKQEIIVKKIQEFFLS